MKQWLFSLLLCALVVSVATGQSKKTTKSSSKSPIVHPALPVVPAEIQRLQTDLRFLASDSMKGRASGTPEGDVAAYYIANQFRAAGLKPYSNQRPKAGDDESAGESFVRADSLSLFLQEFTVTHSRLREDEAFRISDKLASGSVTRSYNAPSDFYIQYAGQVGVHARTPVVFAGFGITEGPDGYNDYKKADGTELTVAGKIVLVFDGYPQQEDSGSAFQKKRKPQFLNNLRKAEAAKERGAVGMIVVEPRRENVLSFEQRYSRFQRALHGGVHTLPSRVEGNIPLIFASRKIAKDLMSETGTSIDSLYQLINRDFKTRPMEIAGKEVEFDAAFSVQRIETQNVVGIIPGSDSVLSKECVVIGAHYDHVGVGHFGAMNRKDEGLIHNGADDNASGTSALLETARRLAGSHPKRTFVFVAFAAEEMGLLGSGFYLGDQPVWPLRKTAAMINLDMIGRNEDSLLWVGGAFYSNDMKLIAEEANKDVGFTLLYNTGMLTFASDQAGFIRRQIPAIFLFSGLHDDYHTPADDADKINFPKIARVVKLATNAATLIANRADRPKYGEVPMNERARMVKESGEAERRFRPNEGHQERNR